MRRFYLFGLVSLATVAACAQVAGIEDARPGWTTGTSSTSTGSGTTSTSTSSGGMGGSTPCMPGATQSCYTGPAGTENVGICKAGTQTCKSDGSGYGECVGQVTPQPENCSTPSDEDCDGAAPPCKGAVLWAKRFGDVSETRVTTDADGNVIVAGAFSNQLNFGGSALSSAGGTDIFVAKLSPSGAHIWSKSHGDALNQLAFGVATDPAGNVVLTGTFTGVLDFGGAPLTNSGSVPRMFIAKLSPTGEHLWSLDVGSAAPTSIVVDVSGNVFTTGSFTDTMSFKNGGDAGAATLTPVAEFDTFLVKLDANGNHQWSQRFALNGETSGWGVALDGAGNVFMTGNFSGAVDFGGNTFNASGASFLAKFDTNGNHQWSKGFTAPPNATSYTRGVATDNMDNPIVTGVFSQSINIGGTALASAGGTDIFLGKLASDGTGMWAKGYGDAGLDQRALAVASGKQGNILIAGQFDGAVDFGGGSLASVGTQDAFIAKLDPAGQHQWSKRFGDNLGQLAESVALDPDDNALVTGRFNGTMDFGSGIKLTAVSTQDIYVAKFAP